MSNKVGHEGTQSDQPSSLTSAQDLNQHRRQREELDSNQSNQRRRVDDIAATDDNKYSSSLNISQDNLERNERLRQKFYHQWDMAVKQMEEDAIHDSDDDDDDEDNDDDDDEAEDQNQEWADSSFAAEVVHDVEVRVTNEDGSVRRYDFGMLIDGLSSEQLRELDERIVVMVQRSSEEIISKQLKTRVHATSADSTEGKTEICAICQDGYENQDKIATLDCKHEYHEDCIAQWLVRKNVCPICKRQALKPMVESKKEEVVVNEC